MPSLPLWTWFPSSHQINCVFLFIVATELLRMGHNNSERAWGYDGWGLCVSMCLSIIMLLFFLCFLYECAWTARSGEETQGEFYCFCSVPLPHSNLTASFIFFIILLRLTSQHIGSLGQLGSGLVKELR